MQVQKSIDWLSFSFKGRASDLWLWNHDFERTESKKPHYKWQFSLKNGVQIFVSDDKKQGNLCVISGKSMKNLRDFGTSDIGIIANCEKHAQNFTRIDYAVDIIDDRANIADISNGIKAGVIPNIGKKSVRHIEGLQNDQGHTVYIGSRSSEIMLRAYDKAVEHKVRGISWARLELELKRNRARQFAHLALDAKSITRGDSIMLGFADLRQCGDWIGEALKNVVAGNLEAIPRKKSNYGTWLDQVLNSIRKRALDSENHADIAYFRTRLNEIELL